MKDLVVVEQLVKGAVTLLLGNAVTLGKSLLNLADPLPDADLRPFAILGQPVLEIPGRGQVVGVDVGLQQAVDGVPLFLDQSEQGIGRLGGDGVAGWVKVEDRVDDDGGVGRRVGYDVLPGRGLGLKDGVDNGLHGDRGGYDCGFRVFVSKSS